jgi:hypothetical protein
MVEHGAIIAAGFVAERAGEPAFAEPGLADDDQVLASSNPIAGGKLCKQRLVERANRLGVEVLDSCLLAQPSELQTTDEPLVLALDCFPIDQHGKPLLERKCGDIWLTPLLLKDFGHAGETERSETLLCWMYEHAWFFFARVLTGRVDGAGRPAIAPSLPAARAILTEPESRGIPKGCEQ